MERGQYLLVSLVIGRCHFRLEGLGSMKKRKGIVCMYLYIYYIYTHHIYNFFLIGVHRSILYRFMVTDRPLYTPTSPFLSRTKPYEKNWHLYKIYTMIVYCCPWTNFLQRQLKEEIQITLWIIFSGRNQLNKKNLSTIVMEWSESKISCSWMTIWFVRWGPISYWFQFIAWRRKA